MLCLTVDAKNHLCHQDKLKPAYVKKLPEVLRQFSAFLGDNKWFAGDKVERVQLFRLHIHVSGFNGGLDPQSPLFMSLYVLLADHLCGLHHVRVAGSAQNVPAFLPR